MIRHDHRLARQIRPVTIEQGIAPHAQGSVLISFGNTKVICAATIEEAVPRWMKEQSKSGGWITAEYSMLPYSTLTRKQRDSSRGRVDGRGTEIQRLIGRSLRAVVDLEKLGPRTLWVDCDVLQADGGTRTAAITGAALAVELAGRWLVEKGKIPALPVKNRVAAISVGLLKDQVILDLDYPEDRDAQVDMNVVMTGAGRLVEVQAGGEEHDFSRDEFQSLLTLAEQGLKKVFAFQESSWKSRPPASPLPAKQA